MKMLLDSTFWTRQRVLALAAGCMISLFLVITLSLIVWVSIEIRSGYADFQPAVIPEVTVRYRGTIESYYLLVSFIAGITMVVLAADVLTPQNRALIEIMATTQWTLARQAVRALLMAVAGTAIAFAIIAIPVITIGLAAEGFRGFEVGHEVLLFVGGLFNLLTSLWVISVAVLFGTLHARSSRVGAAAGVLTVVFLSLLTLPADSEVQYMWLFDLSGLLNYPAQWVLVRLLYASVAAAALLFALKRCADPRFLLRTAPPRSGTRPVRSQKRGAVEVSALAARLRPPIRPESALGAALTRFEARTAQYGYLILLELRGASLIVLHAVLIAVWSATASTIPCDWRLPSCSTIQFWNRFGTVLLFVYPPLIAWVSFDAIANWRGSGLEHLSLSITSPFRYLQQRVLAQISAILIMFVFFVFLHYTLASSADFGGDLGYWWMFLQAFMGMTVYGAGVVVLCVVSISMVGASLARQGTAMVSRLLVCIVSVLAVVVDVTVLPWSFARVRETTFQWMVTLVGGERLVFDAGPRPPVLSSTVMLAAVVLAVAFAGVMMWGGGRLYTRRVRSE